MINEDERARARQLEPGEVARRLAVLKRLWVRWQRQLRQDVLEAVFLETLAVPLVALERACWRILERKHEPATTMPEALREAIASVAGKP